MIVAFCPGTLFLQVDVSILQLALKVSDLTLHIALFLLKDLNRVDFEFEGLLVHGANLIQTGYNTSDWFGKLARRTPAAAGGVIRHGFAITQLGLPLTIQSLETAAVVCGQFTALCEKYP